MPGALGDIIDAIQTSLSQIPPAAIVVGLLFGPTLAYFLYRLYAGPRAAPAVVDPDELYWVCQDCRSANDIGQHRCYHCHADRDAMAGALQVIDHDQLLELEDAEEAGASPGVPVGPGRPDRAAPMPFPVPTEAHDPVQDHPLEVVGSRPPVAIPIEPEEEEDDVLAASQSVSATPARRRRRSTARDGGR